jgi:UDP-2,3-diacylglucosamine hydrolase
MKILGIIAGAGSLPAQIIEHCQNNNHKFFVLVFEDSSNHHIIKNVPHAIVRIGAVGEALTHLRNAGVEEIVMAGGIKRPSLTSLRPDAAGAALHGRRCLAQSHYRIF